MQEPVNKIQDMIAWTGSVVRPWDPRSHRSRLDPFQPREVTLSASAESPK